MHYLDILIITTFFQFISCIPNTQLNVAFYAELSGPRNHCAAVQNVSSTKIVKPNYRSNGKVKPKKYACYMCPGIFVWLKPKKHRKKFGMSIDFVILFSLL